MNVQRKQEEQQKSPLQKHTNQHLNGLMLHFSFRKALHLCFKFCLIYKTIFFYPRTPVIEKKISSPFSF